MVWRLTALPRLFPAPRQELAAVELPRGHIPALDAIRGLAIVAVTIYRFGGGGDGPARVVESAGLVELGSRGVDLFFVLSGFLITGILFDAKGQERYFRNFYMRRTLRIFPLYYAALVLGLLFLPSVSSAWAAACQPAIDRQAWLWFYGANVLQAAEGAWSLGPLNHFWSLAIEEHFYLAWPLVIFSVSRLTAMRICGGLIGISLVSRAIWLASGGNDVAAEVLTVFRLDGLALGGWIALAARSPGGLTWLSRLSKPALFISGAAALAAWLLEKRLLGVPDTAWAILCGALLVLVLSAAKTSWLARCGHARWLRFFGQYSYAMYVFQLPLVYAAAGLITAPGLATVTGSAWLGQAIYCACLFTITTLLAVASWHLFEKRLLTLKHRFEG
jgi:peptidoglycan/LPS O-acetylase OafA/YrhL